MSGHILQSLAIYDFEYIILYFLISWLYDIMEKSFPHYWPVVREIP